MVNVVSPRCKNGCDVVVTDGRYDGFCVRCYVHLFPHQQISREHKVKEARVIEHVQELLKKAPDLQHLQVGFDRQVDGGCSKRRPDCYIDLLTHVVILEVDENAHRSADYCSCETRRMMETLSRLWESENSLSEVQSRLLYRCIRAESEIMFPISCQARGSDAAERSRLAGQTVCARGAPLGAYSDHTRIRSHNRAPVLRWLCVMTPCLTSLPVC